LVKAKVPFHGENLRGIKIPGALLRGGQFDATDFSGADLSGVNFSKAWLRNANLSGTYMAGVDFEEMFYLELDSGIKSCAFSSDGKLLAVSTYHCSVEVYDTTTWEKISEEGLLGRAALAISPCGRYLANASLDNFADVSTILTGKVRVGIAGHEGEIDCITYSPNGRYIATGSKDKTARIWSSHSGKNLRIFEGHTLAVTGVAFSPDGHHIAACGEDKSIWAWHIKTKEVVYKVRCAAPVRSLAYSPDGSQLASCGDDAELLLWDMRSFEVIHVLKGHTGPVFSVAYSPDGGRVASCGDDGTVRFWDPRNGAPFETLLADRDGTNAIAFSRGTDGDLFVSGGKDARLRLWRTGGGSSGKPRDEEHAVSITSVDISMDGEKIVTGCKDGVVRLWDTLTGKRVNKFKGHASDVIAVAFSPNGDYIASSSKEPVAHVWNFSTKKLVHKLKAPANFGSGIAFAPDGKRLATSLADHSIQVWNVAKGTLVTTLTGHEDKIRGLVYSPNGDHIASWSNDKTVRLWNTRKCIHSMDRDEVVTHVAFSPDGMQLISTAADGSRSWNVKTGEADDRSLNVLGSIFSWFTYSSDGNRLAAVNAYGNHFSLWDMDNSKLDQEAELFHSPIGSAYGYVWRRCKSNGKMILASINTSNSLRIEELTEGMVGGSDSGGSNRQFSGNLRLLWNVGTCALTLGDAIIDDIVGLSDDNHRLIEQRANADCLKEWHEGPDEKYFEEGGYFDDDAGESEGEVEVDEEENVDEAKSPGPMKRFFIDGI
jgi:WD40 repeat protein